MSPEQLQQALDRAREYLTEVEAGHVAPLPPADAALITRALLRLDGDRKPKWQPAPAQRMRFSRRR